MDLHAAVWTCMDLMHSCCYSAAITSLMCRVAFVRPCRIRITPKSWNRKWPQVKLRSELTISEQCSENISHKHALSYKKQRPTLRVGIRPRRRKNCFRPPLDIRNSCTEAIAIHRLYSIKAGKTSDSDRMNAKLMHRLHGIARATTFRMPTSTYIK